MVKPRPSYFKRHHPRHVGVVQRCRVGVCNPDTRCRVHSWSWSAELPSRSGRRQRHGKGGYLTAREAADARAEAIHRHKIGKLPDVDAARVTLEQWLPRWIDEREQAGELRDTTAATYRQLIEHKPDGLLAGQPTILTKLGHMRLVDLRGTHLTQAYQALMADRAAARAKAEQANQRRKVRFGVPPPLGPVTIARLHAVVSGALKTAMKEDIMPTNPAANAKLPKRERTKCIPWPPEVLGAFLDAVADHRLYPVFVLAAFTGLRRGEIAGLQWADIDLDGAKLTVARQRVVLTGQNEAVIHHDTKTAAGQRVVWLDSATADTLRRWRKQQNEERLALGPDYSEPGVWLFTDEAGRPHRPEHYTKSFQREVRRLGFPPAHLHSLRHVRAASLISVGEEITTVSKLLGHASVKVTADIYGSLYEAKGREAGEKAAALVPRKRQSSSG